MTVLYGRSEPDEIRPFRIWSGLLRSAMRQAGDIPGRNRRRRRPTLARILPELVRSMELPAPGPAGDLESERRALFRRGDANDRPADRPATDADRARRPSLGGSLDPDAAGQPGRRQPARRVLALGIYRDTELPRTACCRRP